MRQAAPNRFSALEFFDSISFGRFPYKLPDLEQSNHGTRM